MLGFAVVFIVTVPSAADARSKGRELRGGGGGGGGGGGSSGGGGDDGESCDGFCEGGEMMLVLGGIGSVLMCGSVGLFIWWKKIYRMKQKTSRAMSCQHPLTRTSASQLAARDASYSNSWICDVCSTRSSDLQASFHRCSTCLVDFCQGCYASRGGQPVVLGQVVGLN